MATKIIHTPGGDRLQNKKTKNLAGSPPKKPRVPKPNSTLVKNDNNEEVILTEDSPVEKSFEKFSRINSQDDPRKDSSQIEVPSEKYEDLFNYVLKDLECGEHILEAIPKDPNFGDYPRVAWIQWDSWEGGGRIVHIEVTHDEHRRRGLATALYERAIVVAQEMGLAIPIHHNLRTREGDAWANSTGDIVPLLRCTSCGEHGHYGSDCKGAAW